jgi:membrane protein implicated in regulation of membrane protease activity
MDQKAGDLMAHLLTYLPLLIAYGFWLPIMGGALAVAWFLPPFRTPALIVAASVVVGLVCFQVGDNTGADRIQKQWNAAVAAATEQGEKARVDAEQSVAAEPSDRSLSNDPDNRNRP